VSGTCGEELSVRRADGSGWSECDWGLICALIAHVGSGDPSRISLRVNRVDYISAGIKEENRLGVNTHPAEMVEKTDS
jgi:hypothetical protein